MSDDLWSVELGRGMGVLVLGAQREVVVTRLAQAGVELDPDEPDDGARWLYVDDLDAELLFSKSQPRVLREIKVEDQRLRFGPLPVIGRRLHEVLGLLQVQDAETLWQIGDQRQQQSAGDLPRPADAALLDQGTCWIPALGLGLEMLGGEIFAVRLRQPEHAPKRGVGTFTPAQRELSSRPDLNKLLRAAPAGGSQHRNWFQSLLTLALIVALGLLIWRAVEYQRRWNAAPVVEGEVIAVHPPPPEPFPNKFTITYRDQAGGQHEVVLGHPDLYGMPQVGEKVELRYLPDAPEQVLGPARARDIAFDRFFPWAIGLFGTYLALQVVAAVVSGLWASRRAVS